MPSTKPSGFVKIRKRAKQLESEYEEILVRLENPHEQENYDEVCLMGDCSDFKLVLKGMREVVELISGMQNIISLQEKNREEEYQSIKENFRRNLSYGAEILNEHVDQLNKFSNGRFNEYYFRL
ncbi:hypothetical protein [Paenibacillus sp. Cedars]|uniref:hypothetical protein n=1 Tax=Paenibacillus sp. Cedars TaxID=1980674 RepID=UPI0011633C0F|nr:hypothetical protein [Paenibacillus sp. Cedars]AWP30389.1 hypothetical protein B9D94_28970 [Paenibacillus sp. Cedars]